MTIENLFYVFFFLTTVSACSNALPGKDCNSFHNGKFKSSLGNELHPHVILREDSIQKEYYEGEKDTIYGKIRWTNACEYEMQLFMLRDNNSDPV
jgi:hypothetical protein